MRHHDHPATPRQPMRHFLRNLRAVALTLGVMLTAASTLSAQQDGTITIDAAAPGLAIPSTLFGVFFEEINLGGEGGLYGELVQNRSFNNSTNPDLWTLLTPGIAGWTVRNGTWSVDTSVSPGAYRQSANGEDYRSTYAAAGSGTWTDYSLTLQARKLGGSEGFFVMFNVADQNNWFRWNIGGWNNTKHAVQYSINGAQTTGPQVSGSVNTGQWYDIKIAIQGNTINCYLDDVLTQTFTTGAGYSGSIGLATWNTQAEFRNIVVNGPNSQVLYQSDFYPAGSATGEFSVDTSKPLNATNTDSLKLTKLAGTGAVGAANAGFFGIPVQSGSAYNLSAYACTEGFAGPLTARLESADGGTIYAQTTFSGLNANWQRFVATLVPTATDANARLVVSLDQPGTVWLDVVSLFPQATYKNRSNGLREDLADAVAALKPGFFRFPGGCFVEGRQLADAYRWKESIGDISERPSLASFWGYQSSNGLGYHEYLLYCEDLGAEPLFCINVGMSHSDVVPLDQMGEYVQDALDAIEYANGDVSTTWGAKRAAAGHPAPFNLKYIEVGNENGGAAYNDRYALFYDAIRAAYPDIKIVACVWGGTPTSRPFDLMDEHYYTSPATMLSYATKYDSYSRAGPKVFVGEYAVTSGHGAFGNLAAALGEAAFMTGMERNCDVVRMASYAPLFCSLNMQTWKWMPDAIYFDNTRWFGTPAYYVQKMFANNMGTELLPIQQDFAFNSTGGIGGTGVSTKGGIGLSTWNTRAEFRNIVVTGANSQVLYQSDFDTAGAAGWTASSGTWTIDTATNPDAYMQGATGQDYRTVLSLPGSDTWKDYTLTLQARKLGGSEGFLIMFNVADPNDWIWWNLGGWNNTAHAVEYSIGGTKASGSKVGGSINTNQWYDVRITLQAGVVSCYLDNVLVQTFHLPSPIHSVASVNESTREIILKSVNPTDTAVSAQVVLNGIQAIAPTAQRTLLTSASPSDENSLNAPVNIAPVTDAISTPSTRFALDLPAYSVNIVRIQMPALPPQNIEVLAGNQSALISWSESAGATAYTVMRSTSIGGPYETVASGLNDILFTDTGLTNGTTYYYMVVATNSAGASPASTQTTAIPESPHITEAEVTPPLLVIVPEEASLRLTSATTVIGHTYQLQSCENLGSGTWTDVGVPVPGTGSSLEFNVPHDDAKPQIFYRIVIAR